MHPPYSMSGIWLAGGRHCLRGIVLEVQSWPHCKLLNLMLKHNNDDMYVCTLSMDVLHINEYMLIPNTNNEVACHFIVSKISSHYWLRFKSLQWHVITTMMVLHLFSLCVTRPSIYMWAKYSLRTIVESWCSMPQSGPTGKRLHNCHIGICLRASPSRGWIERHTSHMNEYLGSPWTHFIQ